MDAISIVLTLGVLCFGVFLFFIIYPLGSFLIDEFYECLIGGLSFIFDEYDYDEDEDD